MKKPTEMRDNESLTKETPLAFGSPAVPPGSPIRRPTESRSRWWVWLLVLTMAAGGAYYWFLRPAASQAQEKKGKSGELSAKGRAVPVVAVSARRGDVPVYMNGLGTVTALNTVTVRSRVDGELVKVAYEEGQTIKQGDPLVEIDPRPFQAQIDQAEGQLAKDTAQLGLAQANLVRDTAQQKYAQTEADRYGHLVDEGVFSKDQGEQVRSSADALAGTLTADRAAIESARAQVTGDQAAINTAKLQLTYAHIAAPLSGRIGLRLVDRGNIVHATDTTGLAVITQLQPIAVVFNIPEDSLRQVMPKFSAGVKFTVLAYDRDLRRRLAEGKLLTIDNQVDPTTGTVKFKAIFDNLDNSLFPNQFVNARLLFDMRHDVVIIPTAALQRSPQSTYVYVVGSDHAVKMRNITTTLTEGDDAVVESGLTTGETVVVDGLDKLQDGTRVQVTMNGPGGSSPKE